MELGTLRRGSATSPDDSGSEFNDGLAPSVEGVRDPAVLSRIYEYHEPVVSGIENDLPQESEQTDAPVSPCDNESDEVASKTMSLRAYQREMLEESLQRNVIVAMDTGSGKTQVAILRLKAELERSSPEKVVWFLAPTVSLCAQQFKAIENQARATPMKLLIGNDNVENWKAETWVTILENTRIIVSTPQILYDALSHAFVRMRDLSLIILDEAHNYVKKSAGNKIMGFYHREKQQDGAIPAILGLTASPSMKAGIQDLENLESQLDAKCVSPTLHREELLKWVKQPVVAHLRYGASDAKPTRIMLALKQAYDSIDILQDPYILYLQSRPTERNQRDLTKVLEKGNTFSIVQMKGLYNGSKIILQQLGPWAADRYITKLVSEYMTRVASSSSYFDRWMDDEKKYLARLLQPVASCLSPIQEQEPTEVTEKARLLLEELLSYEKPVTGIIFVRERITVTMLQEVLTSSSAIRARYHIGTMVGMSNYGNKKKNIYEFDDGADLATINSFGSSKINLLIATSVLEEGIDVRECNLVVCFDKPDTPKAFIQRRGRARMRDSRLVLMDDTESNVHKWQAMEEEMKQRYQDEQREHKKLELLEEMEDAGETYFEVESTGARLDLDAAKSRLEHFCRVLSQGEFVDSRPDYIITRHWDTDPPRLGAKLILPSYVPVEQRYAESKSTWMSEKNATKDAAFQAYIALYQAGLIGEDLLPLKFEDSTKVEGRAAEVQVEPPFQPWRAVARAWEHAEKMWFFTLGCYHGDELVHEYGIVLPIQLDKPRPIQVFIDAETQYELRFTRGRAITPVQAGQLGDESSVLLALHFAHRWSVESKDHVVKIAVSSEDLQMSQLGSQPFDERNLAATAGQRLIRDHSKTPFLYSDMIDAKPPIEKVQHPFYDYDKAPADVPYLVLKKWTRRADFLHRPQSDTNGQQGSEKPYGWVLPVTSASVDTVPVKYARFGMLIPSIIHELEVNLMAKEVATTILGGVRLSNLDLVREAISSRSASEPLNYERLEFLGDSILKYCATIQTCADHPDWPEGYLSLCRDRLIANSRLSRAAIEKGLSKFILRQPFTGQKWRPLYVEDLLEEKAEPTRQQRPLSTKTLADVVEALIGASYQDGGIPKARSCIAHFLDELEWKDTATDRDTIFAAAADEVVLPPDLAPLEEMIGYRFRKKSLLVEAMTHASFLTDIAASRCYDRLEFLGDAVLDNIIVTKLFALDQKLPHFQMHLLKTAMVNGDFLAFVALEHGAYHTESVVTRDLSVATEEVFLPLWKFMRHASAAIGLEQEAVARRHAEIRKDVLAAIAQGTHYPWALLARLQARKLFSDVFEALIGALWVDSGSLDLCKAMVERFGILSYLDRILRDDVQVQHPKEELGKEAVAESVSYKIQVVDGVDGEREYKCRVEIGGRLITEVDKGVSKEEVKTKAAEAAMKVLTREKEARRRASDAI